MPPHAQPDPDTPEAKAAVILKGVANVLRAALDAAGIDPDATTITVTAIRGDDAREELACVSLTAFLAGADRAVAAAEGRS